MEKENLIILSLVVVLFATLLYSNLLGSNLISGFAEFTSSDKYAKNIELAEKDITKAEFASSEKCRNNCDNKDAKNIELAEKDITKTESKISDIESEIIEKRNGLMVLESTDYLTSIEIRLNNCPSGTEDMGEFEITRTVREVRKNENVKITEKYKLCTTSSSSGKNFVRGINFQNRCGKGYEERSPDLNNNKLCASFSEGKYRVKDALIAKICDSSLGYSTLRYSSKTSFGNNKGLCVLGEQRIENTIKKINSDIERSNRNLEMYENEKKAVEKKIKTYESMKQSCYQQCLLPSCTSNDWECSELGACQANGEQIRTCTKTRNCLTDTGKPAESQSCTYVPTCTTSVWSCSSWSLTTCPSYGTQIRTCTKTTTCEDRNNIAPGTTQPCTTQVAQPIQPPTFICGVNSRSTCLVNVRNDDTYNCLLAGATYEERNIALNRALASCRTATNAIDRYNCGHVYYRSIIFNSVCNRIFSS